MPGWVVLVIVAAAAVGLFALAWWSSGRARPLGKARELSQTEKDYLAEGRDRGQGQYGSFGGFGSGS